jgi:hypothetical protein
MKYPKAYVLYANENYIDIVNACAKSIKTFSNLPVFVYLLNCDKTVLEADKTINWECDIDADETEQMYLKQSDLNFYVNRASKRIYRLIKERPLIVKHALKMANLVCYVDCDSIATKHIDRAFKLFNEHSFYPFFSEGIYDFLMMNGRGGATGNDLSTTLEHPACELFGINQNNRKRYRTSNIFVAGQNCIEFLDTWYWMMIHPKILADPELYAPFQDETIANCLLFKHNFQDGLPYVYTNGGLDRIDEVLNIGFNGSVQYIAEWFKIPVKEEDLLLFHGEKRTAEMNKMIEKLKKPNQNK